MRKKKEDDEIRLFWWSVSQLQRTQRYVREYFFELPGSKVDRGNSGKTFFAATYLHLHSADI